MKNIKSLFFRFFLLLGFVLCSHSAEAQRLALKTNALDWLTLTPNLSLETRLNKRLTLDIGFACNPITKPIRGITLTNFRFQPELRYWFNRPMARHYVGFAPLFADYRLQFNERKYNGDLFAVGFTYGYALVLSRHWNMEATVGVGVGRIRCYKYGVNEERPIIPNYSKWTPVPVRLGLSFAYIFD